MTSSEIWVFDLDDTLILEEDYVRSGFAHVSEWLQREKGVSVFFQKCWDIYKKGTRGKIFDQALLAVGLTPTPELLALLVGQYRNHLPQITLLSDVKELLDYLIKMETRLAIISDGPLSAQQNKIKALGLENIFKKIILTDSYGRDFWKPHPRSFVEMEEFFSDPTGQFIYLADNPQKDFLTPNQRGWATIQIKREKGQYGHDLIAPESTAHKVVHSLIDIIPHCK